MKYEYNGHLLEEERINLVVKEIVESEASNYENDR